jgi:ethanolamine utilization protein
MNQNELEKIISLVTQQVMAAMEKTGCTGIADDCDMVLVVGDADKVPKDLSRDKVLMDLEDYRTHKDIERYKRVVVTKLGITQLTDIALGRPADEVSCAVVYALLSGVEVIMLEDALSFRRFKDKGSNALYNTLEKYAKTLSVYGVKTYRPKSNIVVPGAQLAKFAQQNVAVPRGSAMPNVGKLVTETDAKLLIMAQGNPVRIPVGAIITPLARDVFAHAGIEVIRD